MPLNVVVIRLVNGEEKGSGAVATVASLHRVLVYTGLRQGDAVEFIGVSSTDSSTDGIVLRFVDDELNGVERALTVDITGVVAIDTGVVQRFYLTCPFVGPQVRQVTITYDDGGINLLMDIEEQFGNRVTSFRSKAGMAIGTGSGVGLAEELIALTFVDIHRNTYIDRFIHRQEQRYDGVTTCGRAECIDIGTAFGITNTVKPVIRSFAHRVTNGVVEYRQHLYVANERTIVSVMCLQVCGVRTGLVDVLLVNLRTIFVVPSIRCLIIADGDGIVVLIGSVDTQTEAVDGVATECALVYESVFTACVERIALEYLAGLALMRPDIRCIHIRDVDLLMLEVLRIDVQAQGNDRVTTVDSSQRVVIESGEGEEARSTGLGQTKAYRVTFTDRGRNCIVHYRHYAYEAHAGAVSLTIVGAEVLYIFAGVVDIGLTAPRVRRLALTDLYRISVEIVLMEIQVQAVNTITTELRVVGEFVVTRCVERITLDDRTVLNVVPDIRSVGY